jgi:hypothetical protein
MNLSSHLDKLREICRKNDVVMLGVFGSVARGEDTDSSDVDLLVRLGKPMGLEFFALEYEFEEALGRKVDLVTEASLSKYIRDDVLADLMILYEV